VGYNELGYDDKLCHPVRLVEADEEFLSEIFFIGHWEPNTEKHVCALVDAGLPIIVRGPGWLARDGKSVPKGVVVSDAIYGEDYAKAINGGKIGLGIFSKWNRNATAGRAFEIPACGTFMLAQKTSVLEKLYEDGKDVVFFSNIEELVRQAKHYLESDAEREKIALAGRDRCLRNSCSWRDRVRQVLEDLDLQMLIKT
jgi:spore maturation protein CgeB